MRHITVNLALSTISLSLLLNTVCAADSLELNLRYQKVTEASADRFHILLRQEDWAPTETAVIVCDMWDSHHSVNAVRRVVQLAPRIDAFVSKLRESGVTIIHAPSSCVEAYEGHAARKRATQVKIVDDRPKDIDSWCDQIPAEEAAAYPVDQSAGGEDDNLQDHEQWAARLEAVGRAPGHPWRKQIAAIGIDSQQDYISDNGSEIWSILAQEGVKNVMLVGVHTNMCVLGRPFGLRRLAAGGKNVVLVRDLTDTMYDPRAWPYVDHFTGTDLIVSHVERFVCPTITSDQVLGDGKPFRFAKDNRPRLVMLIADDEYQTEESLPAFAAKHLGHFNTTILHESDTERHSIIGVEALRDADALMVSVRRRALPAEHMELVRSFVAQAKPVIGIRIASHAFSLKGKPEPEGTAVWDEFDADVWGGSYDGHYGRDQQTQLRAHLRKDSPFPLKAMRGFKCGGTLYKTAPLAPGASILLEGQVADEPWHPVAWTFVRSDSGRSFYTSLGHVDDFAQPAFEALLASGINWACGLQRPVSLQRIKAQNERYAAGKGKQR